MKQAAHVGGTGLAAAVAAAVLMLGAGAARAATFTWNGTGNASEQGNWLENGGAATRLPGGSDDIVLDATSTGSMTWDGGVNSLTNTVASWTQTADYTGAVTIDTRYAGQGDFQLFTINGNLTINGGSWRHSDNSVNDDEIERYRLNVKVNGNFTLGAAATINVDSRGYRLRRGDGKGTSWRIAPSHGGQGGKVSHNAENFTYNAQPFAPTYGSIREPTRLGSGGGESGHGGGAVRIEVTGATQLDGKIWARGGQASGQGNGSGGSIWLTTGTLAGSGELDVAGGAWGRPECGGGGRIAVRVTNGATTGDIVFKAYGGARINDIGGRGGAGTVYIETTAHDAGEGRLVVDNNNSGVRGKFNIPGTVLLETPAGFGRVIVTNTAAVALTGDFAYDFATSGNIEGGGEVRVQNATGVTFPDPFVIGERFRLGLDVPITAVGNWTIATNGVLTHGAVAYNNVMGSTTQPDPATKLFLTLTGNLTIANGGRIDVDGKGHGAGRGEGRGGGSHRVGAGHGGQGGIVSPDVYNYSLAATYGTIRAPFLHGSGSGESGAGGGVARLDVSGTTTIEAGGEIVARSDFDRTTGHANGSGGSIWLRTGTLVGTGTLDASGGAPASTDRPAGGGGRIAVIVTGSPLAGDIVYMALGGTARSGLDNCYRGAAGTVYLETTAHDVGEGDLTVDNNNHGLDHFYAATLPAETLDLGAFARVVVTNHGILAINSLTTVNFGTASIEGGGEIRVRDTSGVTFPASYTLTPDAYRLALDVPVSATGDWTVADGGLLTHSPVLYDLQIDTGGDPARKLDLTLTGNLTVQSGGRINADVRGNGPRRGYGRGKDGHRTAPSHGGEGGTYSHEGYTTVAGYGSVREPFLHGSGAENGIGGGVIKLYVSGTLVVDSGGAISASGGGGGWPNGSGGSIWLRAGTLTGPGVIDASGGETAGWRSGGGGGRIALIVTGAATTGGAEFRAFGGKGNQNFGAQYNGFNGAAGTLYIETQGVAPGSGRIVADNNNLPTTISVTDIEAPSLETPALVKLSGLEILRQARVRLRSSRDGGAVDVATGTQLDLNGFQLTASTLTVAGVTYGPGEYAAADLGTEVIDSDAGLAGRLIILPKGTLLLLR